jgi:hypothetical protein
MAASTADFDGALAAAFAMLSQPPWKSGLESRTKRPTFSFENAEIRIAGPQKSTRFSEKNGDFGEETPCIHGPSASGKRCAKRPRAGAANRAT